MHEHPYACGCVREIPIDAWGEGGGKWSGRIGGLSFMCECAQGELSSMRTGDTASYLLYDFLFSLVFHLLAFSSCVCVCLCGNHNL